ncbi:MAG: U32 family peptidase C-terminal domain-containing protein [Cyanobacteriota bacterium]
MNKPELLMPAGNLEKLKYALHYGADAVYLGTTDYSLRNVTKGETITQDNLNECIKIAHDMNTNVYVTINIYAHNKDINALPEYVEYLSDLKPDAIIFSDIGVGSLIKKYAPEIPLHLSTQANTCNYASAQAWHDFGVARIILARELSLPEIEEIKIKVPSLELEVFIHGSLCISYSGRCLMSDYMTDNTRKSNQGGCAQPCRWKYYLMEENRPGEYFQVNEDNNGSYIMNSKDLCLAEHIKEFIDIGIDSFKVEGRTKSLYYVAVVARTYKKIIDKILKNEKVDYLSQIRELKTAGNRGFTTNFILGKPESKDYDYETSKGKAGLKFLGTSLSDRIIDGNLLTRARNQIKLNDLVEWITPNNSYTGTIEHIINKHGEKVEVANTNDEVFLNIPEKLDDYRWAILRSKG